MVALLELHQRNVGRCSGIWLLCGAVPEQCDCSAKASSEKCDCAQVKYGCFAETVPKEFGCPAGAYTEKCGNSTGADLVRYLSALMELPQRNVAALLKLL